MMKDNVTARRTLLSRACDNYVLVHKTRKARQPVLRKAKFIALVLGVISFCACPLVERSFLEFQNAGDDAYLRGDYTEAENQYKAALKLAEKDGRENPLVLIGLRSLAKVYTAQNRYSEAEAIYKERLEIGDKVWANNPESLYFVYDDLAMFYLLQNRHQEARPLYLRALELREKRFGSEDPKVAEGLEFYSTLLRLKGNQQEADEMEARAKFIRSRQKPQ